MRFPLHVGAVQLPHMRDRRVADAGAIDVDLREQQGHVCIRPAHRDDAVRDVVVVFFQRQAREVLPIPDLYAGFRAQPREHVDREVVALYLAAPAF